MDWLRARSPDGVDTLNVEVESLDPDAPDLVLVTRQGGSETEIDRRTLVGEATDSFTLPALPGADYWFVFDAAQGVVPYRLKVSFSDAG